MKVNIIDQGDGLKTVYVRRTLAEENPSRCVQDVADEDVGAVTEKLVKEMRGED